MVSHRDWTRGRMRAKKAQRMEREWQRFRRQVDVLYTSAVFSELAMHAMHDALADVQAAIYDLLPVKDEP